MSDVVSLFTLMIDQLIYSMSAPLHPLTLSHLMPLLSLW